MGTERLFGIPGFFERVLPAHMHMLEDGQALFSDGKICSAEPVTQCVPSL